MGLKLFKSDILNVHDYEKRVDPKDEKSDYLYTAYYEYFAPDQSVNGKYEWKVLIHERKTAKVLAEFAGTAGSHEKARFEAQVKIKKEMEKYKRSGK